MKVKLQSHFKSLRNKKEPKRIIHTLKQSIAPEFSRWHATPVHNLTKRPTDSTWHTTKHTKTIRILSYHVQFVSHGFRRPLLSSPCHTRWTRGPRSASQHQPAVGYVRFESTRATRSNTHNEARQATALFSLAPLKQRGWRGGPAVRMIGVLYQYHLRTSLSLARPAGLFAAPCSSRSFPSLSSGSVVKIAARWLQVDGSTAKPRCEKVKKRWRTRPIPAVTLPPHLQQAIHSDACGAPAARFMHRRLDSVTRFFVSLSWQLPT